MIAPPAPTRRGARTPAERAATWVSLACAVHCLVLPLAVSVLPALGVSGFALSGRAELVLTVLVVATSLAGVAWGYRRHRDLRIVLATAVGLGAYLVGHAFEESWVGVAIAVGGALTLAASSFVGARLSHQHTEPSCAH